MKKLNSRLTTLASAVGIATIGLGSSVLAQAAPVAANTEISNQASANYTITINGKDTTTTVKSNKVIVTVKPTGSFTLIENRDAKVVAGQTVSFNHTLENTGNTAGTFTLSAENLSNDNFEYGDIKIYQIVNDEKQLVTGMVTVPAGEKLKLVVEGTVPTSAKDTNIGKIKLTASVTETQVFTNDVDSNTDTATVEQGVINLTKKAEVTSGNTSSVKRGQEITYTIEISNKGTGNVDNIIIADVIPEGVTYKEGSARLGGENGTVLTDVKDTTDKFQTTTTDDGKTQLNLVIGTLNGKASQKLVFKVTVNDDADFGDIVNDAAYGTDNNKDGKLDPGEEKTPGNGEEPTKATVTIKPVFLGTINDSETDPYADAATDAQDKNKDNKVEKTVVTKEKGEEKVVEFTTWIHNTGDSSENYTLTSDLPNRVESIEYFTADGAPLTNGEVNNLDAGVTKAVVVKVTLKADASATTDDIVSTVTLTPKNNKSATDTIKLVIDELKVNKKDVDITSKNKGDEDSNSTANEPADNYVVNDNNTALIPVTVHNEGNTSDSYTLTNITDDLPEGSIVKIYENAGSDDAPVKGDEVTDPITLAVKGTKNLVVEVTLPENTPSGTTGTVGTTVTSTSNPDVTNTIYNTVSTQKERKLTFIQDESGSIAPQGEIVYTHTLTNSGNITEGDGEGEGSDLTVNITDSNIAGLTTTVYLDTNNNGQLDDGDTKVRDGDSLTDVLENTNGAAGLSPNESIKVFVKVTGDGNETLLGKKDTTTVTFTPSNNEVDGIAAPAAVSVKDKTSVAGLGLYKTQWIGSCDADASSVTYNITPNKQVTPGECIFYQIKAENTTQYPIKNITINDQIPANTKLNNIPALEAPARIAEGDLSVTPTTADADATIVTAKLPSLQNAEDAFLRFAVKVND